MTTLESPGPLHGGGTPEGLLSTAPPSSLKPHHSTTYCRPHSKESPPRGHIPARTPAVEHFYGRVAQIRRFEERKGFTVTMITGRNQDSFGSQNVYSQTTNPFGCLDSNVQVGDLVLVKEYGCPVEAREDGHDDDFPILMVYNDVEESHLHALGVRLPDGPPDLHPGGYHG